MKISYIAHPVSGDVKGNIEKIIGIVRAMNLNLSDTVPFVPYLADLYALDDNIPEERERGIKNGIALIKAGFITEMRLYGNRISNGMRAEIALADELKIPVIPMTWQTQLDLAAMSRNAVVEP